MRGIRGITLIALVITIIVLLILSGISISILGGENGIIERAKQAKEEHLYAQAKEEIQMSIMDIQTLKINEGKDFSINDITFTELNKSNKNIIDYEESSHKGTYSISDKTINFYIDENFTVTFEKNETEEKGEVWEQLLEIIGINPKEYENKENALGDTEVLNKIKNNNEALKLLSKNKELFEIVCKNDNTIDDEIIKIGVIPAMTNNTTPSPFKINASEEYNGQMAYYAFNQIVSKQATLWWHTETKKPATLQIDMGEKTKINSFSLTAPNITVSMPKDFTLEGSDDSENWNIIKTYSNINNYEPYETTLFILDKTENYRYYKFNISEDNGYSRVAIYEIQFYN